MTAWLIDKSAMLRLAASEVPDEWTSRIERGVVRVSTLTRLEIGYSARSGRELQDEIRRPPLALMPVEYLTPSIEDRAVAVQALLADTGRHRGPSIADLLIAATAEVAQLVVLHVDRDYELIAEVTGQPVERLTLA